MRIFVSGTDTNVGKTLISSWLTLHTGFSYFKPIQTGTQEGRDSIEVGNLSCTQIYPESFKFQAPLSPHLAAKKEEDEIELDKIFLPQSDRLIIEGAGGLLVPINEQYLMIDLIKKLETPVILVSRSGLGTINHTLLSLEALRSRNVQILGVIMNGEHNPGNKQAIEFYGNVSVLAEFPQLGKINRSALKDIRLPRALARILMDEHHGTV